MPIRFNCSVMNSEFVSTFDGVSISLPTAMIAAREMAFLPAADCPLPTEFM
jgi:hypothetical protein